MMVFVSYMQISNSVSQLVTPIISNGEQCYLVSTRYASSYITALFKSFFSLDQS